VNEFRYEDLVRSGTIALVGEADPYQVAWWSPDPRPVIPVDAAGNAGAVHLTRNVRKLLRRGRERTTANAAFRQVLEECRAGREPRWLTDELLETMVELHSSGWAHSIEVWDGEDLVGGAFGIGVGRMISGDSLFSGRSGMAAIAVADMAERLGRAGGVLVDAQWDSPFLRLLGARPMPRDQFLSSLSASGSRVALPGETLDARRLLAPPQDDIAVLS
jgi:leucyl/phenylalanyl-tRNA--protein transferase